MSRFTLDVDSPYPRPEPETFLEKPRPVKYPANNIRYKHYGRTVELLIAKASVLEPGEEQTAFAITIANMMKKSYIGYNRDSVEDSVILDALARMSDGVLQLDMNTQLISTQEILRTNNLAKKNVSGGGKSNKKKKKKR